MKIKFIGQGIQILQSKQHRQDTDVTGCNTMARSRAVIRWYV